MSDEATRGGEARGEPDERTVDVDAQDVLRRVASSDCDGQLAGVAADVQAALALKHASLEHLGNTVTHSKRSNTICCLYLSRSTFSLASSALGER
jgi:hypothetical protein